MQEVYNLNPRTSTEFRDPEKISNVEPSLHKKCSTVMQKKVHLVTGLLLLKIERNRVKATIRTITDIIFLQFTVFPYKFNSP